nr:methyltransferase [Spirosoma foliorum]
MKVCTDACVLGAYADVGVGGRVLDIGTGTGLLALMAAQRNPTASVDAVEVDDAAFSQASENVAASPFAERVQVVHTRIQEFPLTPGPSPRAGEGSRLGDRTSSLSQNGRGAGGKGKLYNRILTNPPFYTNHLRSPDAAVTRALHTDELPFPELLEAVVRLLTVEGQWWVLLPPYETEKLTELANEVGLKPFQRLFLKHNEKKPVFRVITGFSFVDGPIIDETLRIYETNPRSQADGKAPPATYTSEFRALLSDFYLLF